MDKLTHTKQLLNLLCIVSMCVMHGIGGNISKSQTDHTCSEQIKICCRCNRPNSGSAVVDFLFIVTAIVGVCNCAMFCCTLLYVHSSIAIILMGKRGLVALLNLSSWCLVMVEWLFLAVPWGCLRFVVVIVPDHTHLLFSTRLPFMFWCLSL